MFVVAMGVIYVYSESGMKVEAVVVAGLVMSAQGRYATSR